LFDAVGRAIRETDEQLEHLPEDTDVVLVILTDGEENASTEFSLEAIKSLIAEKEKAGWAITYMGASSEAWHGAQSLGVPVGATMNYAGDNLSSQQAFRSNAMALGQYMGGGSSAGGIYRESGVVDPDGNLILDPNADPIVDPNADDLPLVNSAESDEDDDEDDLS
jgi:hypothetical protein